ncbi:MAG TPA: FadR/GntR family transcriptional regulator [Steroidobacteraceae bacterium]|nr:FadR/GntR family transcriptional regulator [Steroidobacteraceae bacterium]
MSRSDCGVDLSRTPGSHVAMRPVRSARAVGALRLHGGIARRLGIAIVSGRYAPGDLLDSEVASSEQLAVSRTAYREAVRILAAKGLVHARPKIGTRVNPRSKWSLLDPEVLDWIFESEPDRTLLNRLFELRKVVECAAAGFAARRRTRRHLEAMRSALARMAKHTLATPGGREADLDFHEALLDATANPFLLSLATGVSAAIRTTTVFKQREHPLRRDPLPDHEAVLEAIAAGDPRKAEKAMRRLIDLARSDTPSRRAPARARSRASRRRARSRPHP